MKNSLRRIFALLMAVMMIAALGMSAMAADTTYDGATKTITFEKTLTKDENAYAPNTTYTFTATPITAAEGANGTVANPYAGPAGGVTVNNVVSAPADEDIGETTVTDTGTIVVNLVEGYNVAGVYRYIVTESSEYKGITCDTTEYYLDVYIASNETGVLSIEGAVMYEKDSGLTDNVYAAKGAFENTYTTADLTLTKKVSGNLGDQTKDFTFTITINGALGEKYHITTDRPDTTIPAITVAEVEKDGQKVLETSVTVTLKHGESVTIYGLSEGDTYTIVENDYSADGYTPSVTKGNASNTLGATPADVEVEITNTKSANVPTGIAMTVLPFVAMIALAAIVAVLFFQKRERREA